MNYHHNFLYIFCLYCTVAGHVHLHIEFEDTQLVDELWLFDFQPFEFDGGIPLVTTGIGSLDSTLSGTCSSVFTTTDFDVSNFVKIACTSVAKSRPAILEISSSHT